MCFGKLQPSEKQYGPQEKFSTIHFCQVKKQRTQKASDKNYKQSLKILL